MNKKLQICTRCIMDNRSDDTITFDSAGRCNYCTEALQMIPNVYFPNEEGQRKIEEMVNRIKRENATKPYNCLMGISGGLDSSYLAYLGAVKWGLRIYAVHVDDGFDEPVATENIRKLCEKANIKMIIEKPDTEQFNDLTRAFLLAGVPNVAIPQDNVLLACLYRHAKKERIRHFLSGDNFALECILQKGNTYDATDKRHIKAIHKQFGKKAINKLPLLSHQRMLLDRLFLCIETLCPLNYIDYNRAKAIQELREFCGFEYYKSKHLENKLTKFIQLYWFVNKFNVDKRASHLSSMIISNQMTREEALAEKAKPLYDDETMRTDIKVLLEKLEMSEDEFNKIMSQPPIQHSAYKTSNFPRFYRQLSGLLRRMRAKR